jgi:cation transport protein ChaC
MRLTAEHVARVARVIDDPGLPPGMTQLTDAEHEAALHAMLARQPPGDVWLFAYGSLIWKPAFAFVEERTAILRGWHRSFCLGWDEWFRGNPEHPGLMLSLDRGGACKGVAYRLPPDAIEENLLSLFRRELGFRPAAHMARWVKITTAEGRLSAVAFVIDRKGGRYVGGLDVAQVADALATAIGHRGSMVEYLHSTVEHLERLGIRDTHLWQLQEMVAERIEAAHAASSGNAGTATPRPA